MFSGGFKENIGKEIRDGSRAAATSKMELFVIIVNLGCCSSPRSASGNRLSYKYSNILLLTRKKLKSENLSSESVELD